MKEAKEAKRAQITDQICRQAQLMRKAGANQTEIGKLLGLNPCTISRLEAAGFDMGKYAELKKARREKERKQAEEPKAAEEQVPGQMEMDLTPAEKKEEEAAAFDQVKMMRFLAGRFELIEKSQALGVEMLRREIDKLNDTLSMILRAVRKE